MLTPAKKKRKSITIRGDDVSDFGALMICAVRYAIGRQSYMPSLVHGFIMRYPQAVTENVKATILRDIEENDRITEHDLGDGEKMTIDHLGDTKIDRPGWIAFRDWLQKLEVSENGKI